MPTLPSRPRTVWVRVLLEKGATVPGHKKVRKGGGEKDKTRGGHTAVNKTEHGKNDRERNWVEVDYALGTKFPARTYGKSCEGGGIGNRNGTGRNRTSLK